MIYPLGNLRYLLHVFPFKASDSAGSARKGKRDPAGSSDDETRIPSSEYLRRSVLAHVLIAFLSFSAATYLSSKFERFNRKFALPDDPNQIHLISGTWE